MKKVLIYLLIPTLILTFLISCESNKQISIKVINAINNAPIDSVYIKVNAGKNGNYNKSTCEGYSNNNGVYKTDIMIGCSFGCYDIYIEYSKKGYQTKTDFNITDGTILLSPIQKEAN